MPWQQPTTDTASWRTEAGPGERTRPSNPNRRRDDGSRTGGRRRADEDEFHDPPLDPAIWRPEPRARTDGANWPVEDDGNWPVEDDPRTDWRQDLRDGTPVGEAATEIRQRIEPGAWQRAEDEQAAGGAASYREGSTGDWRRQLAAQSGEVLAEGESRRFGTQDFVPFRPSGSAPVPVSSTPAAPPVNGTGGRENLLVGDTTGGRWQEPDTQWPPRQPAGYRSGGDGTYERRPVAGGLTAAPGRPNNLLEPDEDEFEESTGGPLAAVGYTVIWYGVPVVLFVIAMLFLNGSQQAHALSTLADAAPRFGLSLLLSMVVAVGLRWASGSWKAASVGLAAAVMGGGLATVLSSAITGNSLS